MIVVGVTGSLASGKSEAAKMLKRRGAKVFDADLAARQAIGIGKPAYKAIVKIFGKQYLKKNGELNRKKLAERVFSDPGGLKKLNILIHPGVIFECLKMIEVYKKKPGILVLDVPLLFESKMECLADHTVVVVSDKKKILSRAKKQGIPETLANKIVDKQWPLKKKVRLADFVVENNGTLEGFEKKILEVIKKIKQKAA